jgi:hypothetical protein
MVQQSRKVIGTEWFVVVFEFAQYDDGSEGVVLLTRRKKVEITPHRVAAERREKAR